MKRKVLESLIRLPNFGSFDMKHRNSQILSKWYETFLHDQRWLKDGLLNCSLLPCDFCQSRSHICCCLSCCCSSLILTRIIKKVNPLATNPRCIHIPLRHILHKLFIVVLFCSHSYRRLMILVNWCHI